LGSVIHNQQELDRLKIQGLVTLDQVKVEHTGDYEQFRDQNVFIRSHGISRTVREKLLSVAAHIIDGTCPTVKRVQKEVLEYSNRGYQIVIVGKSEHPEVIALLGHCRKKGIVVQTEKDMSQIDMKIPTLLVAQTTVAHEKFLDVKKKLLTHIKDLVVIDTTCRYIQKRQKKLIEFAQSVDVVLLIGGHSSSNTGVLFDLSKRYNPRTYRIESFFRSSRNHRKCIHAAVADRSGASFYASICPLRAIHK
jgi:(E)-4-hydroxy-3-methyl-but-2-enyl pyrophosphate reductase